MGNRVILAVMPGAKLGQHWLVDKRVCSQIANSASLDANTTCIEIGGGKGALTKRLLPLCRKLIVYEIDSNWAAHLRQMIPSWLELKDVQTEYEVRELDALKIEWSRDALGLEKDEKLVVAGNLPYYITSPLLLRLAYSYLDISHALFLIQREVAERISASPKDSEYSRLSVSLGAFFKARTLFDVPPDAFKPRPKVMSSVLKLEPHAKPLVDRGIVELFERTVKVSFQMRRKKLKNNLIMGFPDLDGGKIDEIMVEAGVDANARGQEISVETFVRLTEILDSVS